MVEPSASCLAWPPSQTPHPDAQGVRLLVVLPVFRRLPSRLAQYFRCYSPVAFGKKTDKGGDYIRKYVPVLRHFPSKYIYEPWNAPLEVTAQRVPD